MNKVVRREHIRAADLPESVRGDIAANELVTVTVEVETADPKVNPLDALLKYRSSVPDSGRTINDIVQDIRMLRDEWDDQ